MRIALSLVTLLLVASAHAEEAPRLEAADLGPPAPDAGPAPPVPDDELRQQLRGALDRLARHDAELQQLKAALVARPAPPPVAEPPAQAPWYERISIRGYTQLRYTLPGGVVNDKLINEQGDKSIGGAGGFLIRRARLILFGDIHPRVSIYLQPDFASAIGEQLSVAIMRDWYADVFLDRKREFRLRIGQSKVPYGFENMQSSQNRVALDRNDPLNSAVKDERDLGIFFYWAPDHIRRRFKHLVDAGLKGSGDFGVVGVGIYNGQTANRIELNKYPHAVLRVTWPFAIGNQFLEIGAGGFYGVTTVKLEDAKDSLVKFTSARADNTFHDARGHVTVVLYPKPFGVLFEYTVGTGPQLGINTPMVVDNHFLYGGYLQLMYKIDHPLKTIALIPYVRGQMYDGGKKFFANSPRYSVREVELGIEWQIVKPLELVVAYMISKRTSDKQPYTEQYGHVTRLQLQVNY